MRWGALGEHDEGFVRNVQGLAVARARLFTVAVGRR